HCKDHGHILHDEETHGNLPVQPVDLLFVTQHFYNDDGAGEGERYGDVERMYLGEAEQDGDKVAKAGGEDYLPYPRYERDRPSGFYKLEIELKTYDEQQNGDSQFGQGFYLFFTAQQV